MSTSTGAFGLSAPKRRNSRKSGIQGFTGSAAVAALVIGCAWTVYSNILGASIYPSVNSTAAETPAVKRQMSSIVRKAPALIIDRVFADLPEATASIGRVESLAVPSVMFNERFAAASADGVAPRAVDGPQLASASAATEAAKPAETSKQVSASASVQIALATPGLGAAPKTVDAKPARNSVRDMTQRAKAAVMSIGHDKPSMVEKLWGKDVANGPLLAYASAWYKVHRAPEFYASLLNNQPMGFYSSATLIKDGQRHGVKFLPVCVVQSDWDCTIKVGDGRSEYPVRLGLCIVKTLSGIGAKRLKTSHAFHSSTMDHVVEPFAAAVAEVSRHAPRLPVRANAIIRKRQKAAGG